MVRLEIFIITMEKFEAYQRTYVLTALYSEFGFVWYQPEFKLSESFWFRKIGSTIPYIKKGNLTEFKFFCPSLDAEQTAIATILSDMDNELQALTQKLEGSRPEAGHDAATADRQNPSPRDGGA